MPPIPIPSVLAGDAVTSHSPTRDRTSASRAHPFTAALHLWHLLSLDAPTVATLWTALIARSASVLLPPATLPAMFLAVWLLYTVDRLLDTRQLRARGSDASLSRHNPPGLEARHLFHHRHRRPLMAALIGVSAGLAALLPHLSRAALRLQLPLGMFLLGYFLLIHFSHPSRRLPKEIAVGLFFAAAVFIPSVALGPVLRAGLAPLALLFAMLCSLNCIAIYAWEHPSAESSSRSQRHNPNPLTRVGVTHLRPALGAALLACLATACFSPYPSVVLPMALSATLLLGLHGARRSLAPTTLRALADLALITPVLFLVRR